MRTKCGEDTVQAVASDGQAALAALLTGLAVLAGGRLADPLRARVVGGGRDAPVLGAPVQQCLAAVTAVVGLHGLQALHLALVLGPAEGAQTRTCAKTSGGGGVIFVFLV